MRKRMLYLLTVIMILGTLIFTACPVSHAKVYKEGKKYTFTGKVKKYAGSISTEPGRHRMC